MDTLWTALAAILVIEGLLPFFAPKVWRRVFEKVLTLNDGQLRFYGLASIGVGLLVMLILD